MANTESMVEDRVARSSNDGISAVVTGRRIVRTEHDVAGPGEPGGLEQECAPT